MLPAREMHAAEAAANIEPLRRRQAQHGFSQVSFKPIEDRFTPAGGTSACHPANDATDAVALGACLLNQLNHALSSRGIRTTNDVRFNRRSRHRIGIDLRADGLNLLNVS